jgi:hypothetical protein
MNTSDNFSPIQVDFEQVAKLCGVAYGKNARASCKKLFEKIKSNAGQTNGSAEGNGEEADEKPKAKPRTKKAVGPRAAPKKAAAAPKKPAGRGRKPKVEEPEEEMVDAEEAEENGEEEEGAQEDGNGKIDASHDFPVFRFWTHYTKLSQSVCLSLDLHLMGGGSGIKREWISKTIANSKTSTDE